MLYVDIHNTSPSVAGDSHLFFMLVNGNFAGWVLQTIIMETGARRWVISG